MSKAFVAGLAKRRDRDDKGKVARFHSLRLDGGRKARGSLALALMLVATAAVRAEEPTGDLHCDTPQTQREINACAAQGAQDADQRLNVVYRQLLERFEDEPQRALRQAQRAWIEFRDTQCRFEAALAGKGSMAPAIVESCLEQLSKDQTRRLEQFLN